MLTHLKYCFSVGMKNVCEGLSGIVWLSTWVQPG